MLLEATGAEWLFDEQYVALVRACLIRARRRVLVQQFLIDARPDDDLHGEVRHMLHALADAAHRGLDVRILLAQVVVDRPFPVDINEPAARFLIKRGVRVRRFPEKLRQLHTKALVVDDQIVIAGSHNWTAGSFRINSETSVAIMSEDCADSVARHFAELWSEGERYGDDDRRG